MPAQKVEARVGCKVLNRMTALGACPSLEGSPETSGRATAAPDLRLCTSALRTGNRRIVPATSFCEYADTKQKTPTRFALSDDRPLFAFAGF